MQFVFSGFGRYFGAWNVVFLLTSVSQTMLSDGKVLTADDARAFDYKSICTDADASQGALSSVANVILIVICSGWLIE